MEKLDSKKRKKFFSLLRKCESKLHTSRVCKNPYEIEYDELASMKFRLAYASIIAQQMGYEAWITDIQLPNLSSPFTLFGEIAEDTDVFDACLETCWDLWFTFESAHFFYLQTLCDSSSWVMLLIEPNYYDLESLTDREVILCKNLIMNLVDYAESIIAYPSENGGGEFEALRRRFRRLGADEESTGYLFDQAYSLSVLCMYNPVLEEVEKICEKASRWKYEPEYKEICSYMLNGYRLINRFFEEYEHRSLSSYVTVLTGCDASGAEEYSSLFFLNPEVVIMMLLAEMAAKDLLEKIDEERGTENAG